MLDTSEVPLCKTYLYLHSVHDSLFSITVLKSTFQYMREVQYEETVGTLYLCWTLHSSFAMWHVNLYWRSSTVSLVSRCCWHLVCCFNWQIPYIKFTLGMLITWLLIL